MRSKTWSNTFGALTFAFCAGACSLGCGGTIVLQAVPLDNLFDDPAGTVLHAAVASDTYQAEGAVGDLGVVTVIDGGLGSAQTIAPGLSFNFGVNAGGANNAVGGRPANDTYRSVASVPIRTTGVVDSGLSGPPKIEDGVGMHADELVTFDLAAIRAAGGLSAFPSYFTARGGLNDDTAAGDLNLAVIVSDAAGYVLAGYVNGERIGTSQSGGVWTFDAAPAKTLTGSGVANRVAPFAVPIPQQAAYLTLASLSKGNASSDHGVFSAATWESAAIPLGNLFGDPAGTSLLDAIASDPRGQAPNAAGDRFIDVAQAGSLGGDVTVAGAAGTPVVFAMNTAGGGSSGAGLPGNDTRRQGAAELAIQTRGLDAQALTTTGVIEDGIGIHANALVTFDLDQIRTAGDFDLDQAFTFRARAGIGDTADTRGTLRTVVIVSGDDGDVLAGYVNGMLQSVSQSGGVWSFDSPIPGEIAGNTFHAYDVLLSGDARYLTLAATSGDISADHGVFSAARLVVATAVPEPSTFALAALGLLGLVALARRRVR